MYRIKIQSNFFVILDHITLSEISRHPLGDTSFHVYNEFDENPMFSFTGISSQFNDKSNEEFRYHFNNLLDEYGDSFIDKEKLIQFLSENLGKYSGGGNGSGVTTTKITEFEEKSTITVYHNRGWIPIVQVWVYTDDGYYTDADVTVNHNWNTMNSFEVIFNSEESGKIVY